MSLTTSAQIFTAAVVMAALALIVLVPLTDQLTDPKVITDRNDPDYLMASTEGYEATIEIASVELAGIPAATYDVTEGGSTSSVALKGYDTRIWILGDGFIMLTSAGFAMPDGSRLSDVGDTVTMSAGMATAGSYTASYGSAVHPDEAGSLGHYADAFRLSGGVDMWAYTPYSLGHGLASSMAGWTVAYERGEGNDLVTSAEDGDGYAASGFVAPVEYYGVDEGHSIAGAAFKIVPLILLIGILYFGLAAFTGGRK